MQNELPESTFIVYFCSFHSFHVSVPYILKNSPDVVTEPCINDFSLNFWFLVPGFHLSNTLTTVHDKT